MSTTDAAGVILLVMPLPSLRRWFVWFIIVTAVLPSIRAVEYAKPEPEKAFPEFKVYDAEGRPWRVAREDWTGARARVADDGGWQAWLRRERAALDRWMERPRDRVDWAAGWSHDGVSPKDGSRLIWTEEVPGEEVQSFRSPSDPEVPITPKTFAWWVVGVRGRNVDMMVRAARLARLTGEERYNTWAIGQMEFYATNLLKWAPARDGARLFWQTLTEATNLIKFVEVVRLLGDRVTPEMKQRWREQFFDLEVTVLDASYRNIHNIACWQRAAAAQVALLFGDEAAWHEAIDGEFGIRRQVAEGVTSDYLWHEQSFGYNGYVVQALGSLFVAAGLYGRTDELAREMALAENLMLSTTYYRFPNGLLPNPADSGGLATAPNVERFAAMYRVFPTTAGLRALADERSWNTLLDPPPAPPLVDPALPDVTSRNLETTCMAILRSGRWQVFFHYGQLTRSHSQSEALNFSLAFGTTDVSHDPGTVGYGSPLHRGYFTRGLAQNVPLIDGEGEDLGPLGERREWLVEQAGIVSPMRGELLEFSANPARVGAAQPRYRKDARARRTLAIEGDRLVDTAIVECEPGARRRLGLALHLQGAVQLGADFAIDATFADGRPEPFQHWRDPRRAVFRDRAEFDVAFDTLRLHLTIACSGEFAVWHATTPDVPPHRRESLYVETIAGRAEFATTFEPVNDVGAGR